LAQIVELLRCIYRVHLLFFAKSAVSIPVSIALFGASFAFVDKSANWMEKRIYIFAASLVGLGFDPCAWERH
jgi:hypothetical protein